MHPTEAAAGSTFVEFVREISTEKSGPFTPFSTHCCSSKQHHPAPPPESTGAFIPPTQASPPRRELTSTSIAPELSPHRAFWMENNLQQGEMRGNHAALCPPSIPSAPTATVSLPTPGMGWGQQAEEGLQDSVESSV